MTVRDDELRVNPFERRMLALDRAWDALYEQVLAEQMSAPDFKSAEKALFAANGVPSALYRAWVKRHTRALHAARRRLHGYRN